MQKTLWWTGVGFGVAGAAFLWYANSQVSAERKKSAKTAGYVSLSVALVVALAAGLKARNGNHASQDFALPPAPLSPGVEDRLRSTVPSPSPPPQGGAPAGATELLILSADSWCGFSKKMTAEAKRLAELLAPSGVQVKLVSDAGDKETFSALSKTYGAKGFPHSVILRDGVATASIPGYQPAEQMTQAVLSKLT